MSIGAPQYKGTNTETLAGTKTLVANDDVFQNLDPGGAGRTVVMPSGTATLGGRVHITNAADAAENITVQQSDASTTVATISQNESAEFVCNGVSAAAGWQAVGIAET